jgi:hypothetical protein
MSQSCSLHVRLGQRSGLASMRLIHRCPHRRHSHHMLAGIVIARIIDYFFS